MSATDDTIPTFTLTPVTTIETEALIQELMARHHCLIISGVRKVDNSYRFRCIGRPLELLGLVQFTSDDMQARIYSDREDNE